MLTCFVDIPDFTIHFLCEKHLYGLNRLGTNIHKPFFSTVIVAFQISKFSIHPKLQLPEEITVT